MASLTPIGRSTAGATWRGRLHANAVALETGHSFVERFDRTVEFGFDESHERHFENHDLLGGTLHFAHGAPNGLEDANGPRKSELLAPRRESLSVTVDRVGDLGGHLEQEDLSHFAGETLGELFGVPAFSRQHRERLQGLDRVGVDEGVKQSVELRLALDD